MARATLSPLIKAQVEKLTGGGVSSGRRPVSISSPITIPKKPPRSNASSQSSSSYTSVVDQMSFQSESSTPLRRDADDGHSILPTLPSTGEQLAHTAARDRISVKNKRRQPVKQKLSTLRETDDSETNLFPRAASTTTTAAEATPSTPEEEQPITVATRTEAKLQQPLIDLSDLQTTRARLRLSVRTRDRSADNLILAPTADPTMISDTPAVSAGLGLRLVSPMQRSVSLKRPKENTDPKPVNRPFLPLKSVEKMKPNPSIEDERSSVAPSLHPDEVSEPLFDNSITTTQSISRSSSQEHIYDNLDVFRRAPPKVTPPLVVDHDLPVVEVKIRDHSKHTLRTRPVTVHVAGTEGSDATTEFENAFNQLKKRGSIRRVRPQEEKPATPPPSAAVEEAPTPSVDPVIENELPVVTTKPVETTPAVTPSLNRRKVSTGAPPLSTDKVAANDSKPAPSWIDIAKQKQNKFQTISNEKPSQHESEEQPVIESPVMVRKSLVSADLRPNRKSMFESSATSASKTHPFERDSIRALKNENPNRINNLIQFFDK